MIKPLPVVDGTRQGLQRTSFAVGVAQRPCVNIVEDEDVVGGVLKKSFQFGQTRRWPVGFVHNQLEFDFDKVRRGEVFVSDICSNPTLPLT